MINTIWYQVSITNWGKDRFSNLPEAMKHATSWANTHPEDTVTVTRSEIIWQQKATQEFKVEK